MERNDPRYQAYVEILKEELIPAMGCTEPIALAYAAAKAREVLGVLPDSVQLQVSGSIIKNVKSVIVPNTGHLKGMEAAVAAGIIAGSAEKELEVISEVSEEKKFAIRDYLQTVPITIEHTEQGHVFDIVVTERCGQDYARVRIADYHTNICRIEKNGTVLYEVPLLDETVQEDARADRSLLNMQDIWDFAETADLRDVADLLERQIRYNNAIAEEGLLGDYGANIGRVLLTTYGNDVSNRAKAKAAAGSDARMNGCEMPVVIVSGSGNQGITASVPVWKYGQLMGADEEKILRAVCLSDLITIHQKTGIGRLSAYCGAVSAGVGAGCGIAWLRGADYEGICHTLENAVAMISGCICDGAKASCASKIAMGVDCGILGYDMYRNGDNFRSGDGIVGDDVEDTIRHVGVLATEGMRETDRVILKIMTE
jgi:L-cysteine desulfidase